VIPEAMERSFNKVPIQFPAEHPLPSHVAAALTRALELKTNARTRDMREFKQQLALLVDPPPPVKKKFAKIILVPVFALIALCIILGGVNRVSSSGTHTLMSDSLVGYDADDVFYVLGSEEWRRDEITSVTFLDTRADEPDDSWDVSDEQDGSVKAWVDESDGADLYIAAKGGVILPEDCEDLFNYYENMTEIDLTGVDTSNVTSMNGMFYYCHSLEALDVSGFDTSNVTDMSHMFCYCTELQEADVSNFNTSRVTDMSNLFENCKSLTVIDVSGFDTSNVTDMSSMFSLCASVKELDVSGFDTSQVTSMSCMFDFAQGCSLTELDITGFDTSQVTNMRCMFLGCTVTDLSVDDFDTSNVTDMFRMFKNCTGLETLNVSNFDTSQVTTMEEMFYGCWNLPDLDLSGFDISNVSEEEDWSIFLYDCSGLKTLPLWEGISTELKAELYEQTEIFISPEFGGIG